jgi:uncharacterized protein
MYPRLDAITHNLNYQLFYSKIQLLETSRKFCKHDLSHFLDVARIGYILSLEEGVPISKELLYAAALLHDIGRHEQYLFGTPHERSSSTLCVPILKEAGFSSEEVTLIQQAILDHRTPEVASLLNLSGYLYRGDKASRPCHNCSAESECSWSRNKKNMNILW